jgi:hypothetical protein
LAITLRQTGQGMNAGESPAIPREEVQCVV